MLYITFKRTIEVVYNVDDYFNFNYDPDWFLDPLVQQMIEDVDKSVVLSPECIQSPVLGQIPPTRLSGGVKALILMLKEDFVVWATACGDNCAKWIIEIADRQDITICLEHTMEFPERFDAFCIDNMTEIHSMIDFRRCSLQCL